MEVMQSLYGTKRVKKYCSDIKRVWQMKNSKIEKNNLKPFAEMKKFLKKVSLLKDMKKFHKISFDDLVS